MPDPRRIALVPQQRLPQAPEAVTLIGRTLPIELVRDRIFRAWIRGVPERSLARMYAMPRVVIEDVARERTRAELRRAA